MRCSLICEGQTDERVLPILLNRVSILSGKAPFTFVDTYVRRGPINKIYPYQLSEFAEAGHTHVVLHKDVDKSNKKLINKIRRILRQVERDYPIVIIEAFPNPTIERWLTSDVELLSRLTGWGSVEIHAKLQHNHPKTVLELAWKQVYKNTGDLLQSYEDFCAEIANGLDLVGLLGIPDFKKLCKKLGIR